MRDSEPPESLSTPYPRYDALSGEDGPDLVQAELDYYREQAKKP
jgi:hypothetical protein